MRTPLPKELRAGSISEILAQHTEFLTDPNGIEN
jgi:hypothetical protein